MPFMNSKNRVNILQEQNRVWWKAKPLALSLRKDKISFSYYGWGVTKSFNDGFYYIIMLVKRFDKVLWELWWFLVYNNVRKKILESLYLDKF